MTEWVIIKDKIFDAGSLIGPIAARSIVDAVAEHLKQDGCPQAALDSLHKFNSIATCDPRYPKCEVVMHVSGSDVTETKARRGKKWDLNHHSELMRTHCVYQNTAPATKGRVKLQSGIVVPLIPWEHNPVIIELAIDGDGRSGWIIYKYSRLDSFSDLEIARRIIIMPDRNKAIADLAAAVGALVANNGDSIIDIMKLTDRLKNL